MFNMHIQSKQLYLVAQFLCPGQEKKGGNVVRGGGGGTACTGRYKGV